jgi:hypothetical protein
MGSEKLGKCIRSVKPKSRGAMHIRAADAKEVGVGNPAEETCCCPNNWMLSPPRPLSTSCPVGILAAPVPISWGIYRGSCVSVAAHPGCGSTIHPSRAMLARCHSIRIHPSTDCGGSIVRRFGTWTTSRLGAGSRKPSASCKGAPGAIPTR